MSVSARKFSGVMRERIGRLFGGRNLRWCIGTGGEIARGIPRLGCAHMPPHAIVNRKVKLMHEIDHNGLSDLLTPLRKR
ncbi:MAG: hypothetical protein ABL893_06150 [Hyphomicrobium sp.]